MGFSLVFSVLSFSFFLFLPSIFLLLFAPAELCWALDTGSPGNRRNAKDAKDNRERSSVNACLSCLVLSCLVLSIFYRNDKWQSSCFIWPEAPCKKDLKDGCTGAHPVKGSAEGLDSAPLGPLQSIAKLKKKRKGRQSFVGASSKEGATCSDTYATRGNPNNSVIERNHRDIHGSQPRKHLTLFLRPIFCDSTLSNLTA
jgi:hypothetical protein